MEEYIASENIERWDLLSWVYNKRGEIIWLKKAIPWEEIITIKDKNILDFEDKYRNII